MKLSYTIVDLPPVWPGKRTPLAKRAPFKTNWTKTEHMLERELRYLGARKVELALDLPRGQVDLRQDGMLKAEARPRPPVILSFLDRDNQRQAYPCDTFSWWQDNLYAIAVVLEDLRRAERYGVQSALLRAGFKALPAAGQSSHTMSANEAAAVVASFSVFPAVQILADRVVARDAIRQAIGKTHPDRNDGDRKYFDSVATARRIIEAHHGSVL